MQIRDLGEFGVIALLNDLVVEGRSGADNGTAFGFELAVDTGDDAAAWLSDKATELFTTDTVVEGIHFTRETTPWPDLGWKAIGSNISDIAAMGGLPMYALITLGMPPETEVSVLTQLYEGMLEICKVYGVSIIGGDMVRSPVMFITVALTGLHSGQVMLRSTAKPGDRIGVTDYLGGSAGGLRLMLENDVTSTVSRSAKEYLRRSHRHPIPAVTEGRILSQAGVATAMDVSDGLADDLSKLCMASGVSARVYSDQVPTHRLLKEAYPDQYADLAIRGGEDYLLLFTADTDTMNEVMSQLGEGAAVIGEITEGKPGKVILVDAAGAEVPPGPGGWDHFGQ